MRKQSLKSEIRGKSVDSSSPIYLWILLTAALVKANEIVSFFLHPPLQELKLLT